MSLPVPSTEKSIRTSQKMSYLDAALSVFQRPKKSKPHYLRTSKHHKMVSADSSEDLLTRAPSVNNVLIEKHGDPWVSGFLRRLPYTGVLALLMVLLCAGADAVVLYKSDGQEVDTRTISPSVLLAVFSAAANVCLEYARAEGVILAVFVFYSFSDH
jgi:Protein of unknown function (DUF3176)